MAEPFIAIKPIYVGTALAHAVGDVVPDANVKANEWEDLVARASSQKAGSAVAEATAEGLSQPRP